MEFVGKLDLGSFCVYVTFQIQFDADILLLWNIDKKTLAIRVVPLVFYATSLIL